MSYKKIDLDEILQDAAKTDYHEVILLKGESLKEYLDKRNDLSYQVKFAEDAGTDSDTATAALEAFEEEYADVPRLVFTAIDGKTKGENWGNDEVIAENLVAIRRGDEKVELSKTKKANFLKLISSDFNLTSLCAKTLQASLVDSVTLMAFVSTPGFLQKR